MSESRDFVVLTEDVASQQDYSKAPLAIGAMAIFLIPSFMGWLGGAIYIWAMTGAAFMILTRCLKTEEAYASIDLKAIVLIAGMLPLSIALQNTGAAAWAADHITSVAGRFGPWAVVATIFIIASLGTCVVPAATLVVLMSPIAYNAALAAEASPHTFMMALALAAAGSFNSPVAHPSNTMITGPGGYRFVDFLKVGLPLTLGIFAVVMLLLPHLWPLTR